jgi:parallel beta-helix repeat protein
MKRFMIAAPIILALGLGLTLGLLRLLDQTALVFAANGVRYVALDGADANDCSSAAARCQTIQRAVDVAAAGDVIKVAAGTYSDVQARPSPSGYYGSEIVTQVVYISTVVTIQGGYTTTNDFADPPTAVSTLSPQGQGRGMYIAPGITVTLEGLQLVDGNAAGFGGSGAPSYQDAGGGLYADRATVTISDCLFADNVAASAGGIYVNRGAFVLQNSVITANIAITSNAGGLSIYSPSIWTISHNSVSSNTAVANGGGLYLVGGQSDSVLLDNSFVGNKAGGGGGIFMNSEATLLNNQVMSNSASYRGGGLYVNGRSPLIEGNQFIGNDGGGILIRKSDGLFENNIVTQNQIETGDFGAGVYIWGGAPRMVHTTLAQNAGGDGSGVYISDYSGDFGHATLTNTILVSHTTGLYAESGNTATINGVLWYGNTTANVGGSGTVTVSHAYTGSPAFVNPDGWDYHINITSAAQNKGVSTGVVDDIDGDLRLGTPDLGADEFVRHIFLPIILRN